METNATEKLLPFTILDGMTLVAGCAISAWLLNEFSGWPDEFLDWAMLTAYVLYGVTFVGVFVIALQYLRGRQQRLLAGEVVWLIIAVELWPFVLFAVLEKYELVDFPEWYLYWLVWGSPPLVLIFTAAAWAWHFRHSRPRHWVHRVGLGIALLQCIPSVLLIFEWPDLWSHFW